MISFVLATCTAAHQGHLGEITASVRQGGEACRVSSLEQLTAHL